MKDVSPFFVLSLSFLIVLKSQTRVNAPLSFKVEGVLKNNIYILDAIIYGLSLQHVLIGLEYKDKTEYLSSVCQSLYLFHLRINVSVFFFLVQNSINKYTQLTVYRIRVSVVHSRNSGITNNKE